MKKYDSYKDTGLNWLGSIPEQWGFAKINYYSKIKTGGTPNKERPEYWENGTIRWMSSGEVNKEYVYEVAERITDDGLKNSNASILPIDTVMIALNGQGKTKGTVALLRTETTCNQSLAGFICNEEKLNPLYLFFFLKSKYKQLRGLVGDGQREGITLSLLKSLFVPLPSINEQRIIGEFLYYKTSQFDILIQKKQQMIALLEEEKTAVINEAVTKGLNPDAPLKDSGVDWLGAVPAHWEPKKLKYLVHLINDSISTKSLSHKVALENIESNTGRLLEGELSFEFKGCGSHFIKGDVLFSKLRPYLAKVYLAKEEGVAAGELLVFRPKEEIWSEFLFYRILSSDFIKEVNSSTYGSKMPRASWSFIEQLLIPIPSLKEQIEIIQHINDNIRRIESVKAKAFKEIKLMQEYRIALISEAVTGKIDVRDYQPEPINSQQLELA
ncbi:restriction endonuclease subunit S [Rufibacter quisquiliarum]|uniref:Restriction endonuclease S subunit n=1 Tax=Rufibacter quisquiliarum TaxID=1549639 RepID=A0A839GTJ4_9BACT|nr:restriction endonuclease subunit S [Rufibacter quisquiliarum]MBA9078197.1 restriction endonuclease S subunit [Rufibacter quisquiliarum]